MSPTPTALGIFLLRIGLGAMYLAHGLLLKGFTFGPAGTEGFFRGLGLPAGSGYAILLAESLGGLALLLGVQARWVALALSPILAGALWFHAGNGWVFSAANGGWEYPAYLLLLSLVQALLGDGAFALSPSRKLPAPRAAAA